MINRIGTISILGLLVLTSGYVNSAGDDFGLPGEAVLNEIELKQLLSGKTVKGIYIDQNKSFARYYGKDGAVRQNIDKDTQEGNWFIDKNGRRCIIWSGNKKNCRVVVKDNELYKEFAVQKNNKPKLMVIYKKVVFGNPGDL